MKTIVLLLLIAVIPSCSAKNAMYCNQVVEGYEDLDFDKIDKWKLIDYIRFSGVSRMTYKPYHPDICVVQLYVEIRNNMIHTYRYLKNGKLFLWKYDIQTDEYIQMQTDTKEDEIAIKKHLKEFCEEDGRYV